MRRVVKEGLRVTIRRSKTDQDGAGVTVAIPEGRRLRPKVLLEIWLERSGIADGFLFRRLGAGGTVTASPMSDRGRCPAGAGTRCRRRL